MAKGLGASLWAWLNKQGATAYFERTLADERIRRDQAVKERDAERKARDAAEAKLAQADRALTVANDDRAELCKRLAKMVASQAAMTARLIQAASSADDFLDIAESYAAENDELKRLMGNARNQLDWRKHHPEDSPTCARA